MQADAMLRTVTDPALRHRLEAVRDRRADAYDRALTTALYHVERLRAGRGELAAGVVEARFVDGERWSQVAGERGLTVVGAHSLADRSLAWLDRTAGER